MIKILFLLIFFIDIFAKNIYVFGEDAKLTQDKVLIEDSMLLKDKMVVSAKTITYNKPLSSVAASGNVYINLDKNNFLLSNFVYLNLEDSYLEAKPFFIFDLSDNSWLLSLEANKKDGVYNATKTISSTCNVQNPDWKIVANSVKYDKENKWIDLYNPILYIKDIPVLYLPYMGYSLNKTRKTGFLRPQFGYSENEGLLFTEPYYIAISRSADLEIAPTIRTKRGKGVYSTFRFVHSATSKGSFSIGNFRDDKEYTTKYNLLNSNHYGWKFDYTNKTILNQNDDLYVSLKNANDVDYFYLDAYNYTFNTSYLTNKILTSKINYQIANKTDYIGVFFKYFQDTSKASNADTMQILPQINYHIYNNNFYSKFLISMDSNIYNYTREKDYKAIKKSILLPISYDDSFFDDYLKVSLTEQFAFNQVDIDESNISKSIQIDSFVKIYSILSKKYPDKIHHILPSITFSTNNYSITEGSDSDYLKTTYLKKSISMKLNQYLISKDWSLNHEISTVYYIDSKNNTSEFSNLLNSISLKYGNYSVSDNNRFSIKNGIIEYNSINLAYSDDIKGISLSHSYRKASDINSKVESIDLKGRWNFDKVHKFFAEYNYDMVLNMEKYYIIGLSMSKKCWNYNISFKKETLPLLTNDGISSIIQKTIYFEVELIPLGGFKQQYQFKPKRVN